MFCGKCGAQNEDNAGFCKQCGAPLSAAQPVSQDPGQAFTSGAGQTVSQVSSAASSFLSKKITVVGKTLPLVGIIGAAVALLLVIVLVSSMLGGGGGSPENIAESTMNAVFKADGKTIVDLLPDALVKEYCLEEGATERELANELSEGLEYTIAFLDRSYDRWSVSAKAVETTDLSRKQINNLNSYYEDYGIEISEGKTVTVELTITGDGDKDSADYDINIIKVDGKWCLDVRSISSFT